MVQVLQGRTDVVATVEQVQDLVDRVLTVTNLLRTVGLVLLALVGLTVLFIIVNTIRLAVVARSEEIEIMRLVGASDAFIRWPFIFEGALVGLLGALITLGLLAAGAAPLSNLMTRFFEILPIELGSLSRNLAIIVLVTGVGPGHLRVLGLGPELPPEVAAGVRTRGRGRLPLAQAPSREKPTQAELQDNPDDSPDPTGRRPARRPGAGTPPFPYARQGRARPRAVRWFIAVGRRSWAAPACSCPASPWARSAPRPPARPVANQQAFQPFWDTYNSIQSDFALGPVDRQTLVEGAIKGMIDSLGDPFSQYLSPDNFQNTLQGLSGHVHRDRRGDPGDHGLDQRHVHDAERDLHAGRVERDPGRPGRQGRPPAR